MNAKAPAHRNIVVLGSTGSIGTQTLDVVRQHSDRLSIVGLAVNSSLEKLQQQAREFNVPNLAMGAPSNEATTAGIPCGQEAVLELCRLPEVDLVVNALVGAAGLRASYETLRAGKALALANKESLVVGGDLLIPMSTHETLGKTRADLAQVTVEQALAHPTWRMGSKITIDSATLMNKGLEVIEAHHLFAMPYEKIEVVVQPQSAIHSMVEFSDGSVKAHLGTTDMRIPIQFALSYPERWDAPVEPLDFRLLGSLEFAAPDTDTFRCLALARAAGSRGGTLPAAMNAANEVAVATFLAGSCPFLSIADAVEAAMDACDVQPVESLEQLEEVDARARAVAAKYLNR